jgi:ABC-type dipeptide/oligopeptide/nickel transport system ATPase component
VLLVCDEPTASLDVSIRGQILQLLSELPQSGRVGVLFISHDLRVVKDFADNVAVMSNGRIVEHGTIAEVYAAPKAPYTRGLLSAIPSLDPRHRIILSDRAALANKGPWSGTGSTTQQGDSLI